MSARTFIRRKRGQPASAASPQARLTGAGRLDGSAAIIGRMRGTGSVGGWRRATGASLAAAGALALALALAAPVLAASGGASVSLSTDIAQPGDQVTITAAHLGGPGDVPILLAGPGTSVQLGTAKANAAGAFTTTVTIPADTADGDYDVIVYDTAEDLIEAPLHIGPTTTDTAIATDTSDQGHDTATVPDDSSGDASPTAAPSDPYPVPEGIRDIAFVLLVGGSLALAAWGAGPGRRP